MNMLNAGLSFLEKKLLAYASSPIEYRQDADEAKKNTVDATFGKTDIEARNVDGHSVQSFVWDFLVNAADLAIIPTAGDTIIVGGVTYEVMDLGGEGCYRCTSPTRETFRIHTREIG